MSGKIASDFMLLTRWAEEPGIFIDVHKSHVSLSQRGKSHNFFTWIFSLFSWANPEVNRYAKLKKVVKRILEDENTRADSVEKIFRKISREFYRLRKDSSVAGMIQANDLLEAYATGRTSSRFKKFVPRIRSDFMGHEIGSNIEEAAQAELRKVGNISDTSILLLEYRKIDQFVKELELLRAAGEPLTQEIVKNLLEKNLLKVEDVPMGRLIDLLYRHRFAGRHDLEKLATQIAVWRFGSVSKVKDVQKTVKFFKELHIDLWVDIRGKLFSFSEVFGYDIRAHKTFHESFTRSFAAAMKERLLKPFIRKREEVREVLGEKAEVVSSAAFARNTFLDCPKGSIKTPFKIRGKIISEHSDVFEEIGYAGAAPFTFFDLFGGYASPTLEGVDAPIVSDSSGMKRAARGQAHLLGAMSSFVNQHHTTAVIHRLAPSDPHHFYATADAEVLSKKECCEELQKQILEKEALGAALSEEERSQLAALERLKNLFQEDVSPTINIAGTTLSSVNRLAVRHDLGILATNDRKIMMLRHADKSISFHIYIGATVVNSIDVRVGVEQVEAGRDFGWMSYGSEKKEGWIEAKTYAPAPAHSFVLSWPSRAVVWVLNFLRGVRKKIHSSGRGIHVDPEGEGRFDEGGSTVISLYPPKYALIPELRNCVDLAVKEVSGQLPETIEIENQLGDVLLTPVVYQIIQLMTSFSIRVPTEDPVASLRELHQNLLIKEKLSSSERAWTRILGQALAKEDITLSELPKEVAGDDRMLLQDLVAAIQQNKFFN